MTIRLDKVPRLLYINEDGNGGGQVYEKGVRIKNLQEVNIKAKTQDDKVHFLRYLISYYDQETHAPKRIGSENPFDLYTIAVSVKDTDVFQDLLDTLKLAISNHRIPMDIKESIANKMHEILRGE